MTGTSYVIGGPYAKWEVGVLVQRVSVLANAFIRFSVRADADGVPVDPTNAAVSMAFLTSSADPVEADWVAGEWDTTLIGTYVAQVRSGEALPGDPSGTAPLVAGHRYNAWVKIDAAASGELVVACTGVVLVQ